MRYVFGFLCVCALAVVPLVGCSETTGDGGSGGDGGSAGGGGSAGDGGSGGMAGVGGSGGMPECQNPEDCDDGEECTTDTCASGVCENTAIDDGTTCAESNECAVGQCASGACELTPVTDGTACGNGAGTCQFGICSQVACTEQGIRDAIAAGGGPYTFDCNGPQTVVTAAGIVIDNDVILDGERNLTVDGDDDHLVFAVNEGVIAELTGLTVTNGNGEEAQDSGGIVVHDGGALTLTNTNVSGNVSGCCGGTISNYGTLILTNSTVSDNTGSGIWNGGSGTLTLTESTVSGNTDAPQGGGGIKNLGGTATLVNSTVSGNTAPPDREGGGIQNGGTLTLVNSTVSGNSAPLGGGIFNCVWGALSVSFGTLTLVNSTVSGNTASDEGGGIFNCGQAEATLINSLIDGDCGFYLDGVITSNGYNIESPGDTCGFDQTGDQPGVTAEELNLGPLADNGGPTETHALGLLPTLSVAIDQIPEAECLDAYGAPLTTDQRGLARPVPIPGTEAKCDVGAFEEQGP